MERNALVPEQVVSCIFTLTDDLTAEFPAVAARALGFERVPLLCAREIPVPGSLANVIRVLIHYYAAMSTRRSTCTCARRPACAPTCRRHSSARASGQIALRSPSHRTVAAFATIGPVALEFSERIARIPSYPAAGGYAERAPKVRWHPTSRRGRHYRR